MSKHQFTNKIKKLIPIRDNIIVTEMNFSERKLSSGLIMLGDDAKTDGIRPRWAKVYAVGPEQEEIMPGQWVLVDHGRWTRGSKVEIDNTELTIRKIDTKAILLVSDHPPESDDIQSSAVHAERKERL